MRYQGEFTREISFPLGGIGTGSVGLSGNGRLIDWEIFNRPNRLSMNEYTNFAVKAERRGEVLGARILQGDTQKDFQGSSLSSHGSWGFGQGIHRASLAGLPHFRNVCFSGFFPAAEISFRDPDFPGRIRLRAMNPFLPGNDLDSSIPCAMFEWSVTNDTAAEAEYTFAFSCGNPFPETTRNRAHDSDGVVSIFLDSETIRPESPQYGNLSVATDCPDAWCQEDWFRGAWFDDVTTFWREFSSPGKMPGRRYEKWETTPGRMSTHDMCTLLAGISVKPKQTKTVRFVMGWYIPNVEKYWQKDPPRPVWKNFYTHRFGSAEDVSRFCLRSWNRLWRGTMMFRSALAASSLPAEALDAVQANLAILKSTTCLRLEDGSFWAWEGVNQTSGSCEGSCSHVWNYAYALPFLFPKLERSMRELEYGCSVNAGGAVAFRLMLPPGSSRWNFRPCADGQFGGVLKFYREWKISGDSEWLRRWWPVVKKTLEYAWSPENPDLWDPQKSGVLTGRQHHTLDVELFGPNAWLTGFYLAALKAAAEISGFLGEKDSQKEYLSILERGQNYLESRLFSGQFYTQQIDLHDRTRLSRFEDAQNYWNPETQQIKYQIGQGCEIDQMTAQWHASLLGLGDIFSPAHRRTALESLWRLNFKSMRNNCNPCRIFSADDEEGAVICSWQNSGDRPAIPIPYAEETMSGFEYALAGQMLQNGMEPQALRLISAVRNRYDGRKRNPWSELECGGSYARSMASYSFLLIYSGFSFRMDRRSIGFAPLNRPALHKTDRYFWSLGTAWGTVFAAENSLKITSACGSIPIEEVTWYGQKIALPAGTVLSPRRSIQISLPIGQLPQSTVL